MQKINRISIFTAGIILAALLAVLSFLYFQAEKTRIPAGNTVEKKEKKIPKPVPKKLSEEERDALRLEREAVRTGQKAEDLKNAAENPETQIQKEMQHAQTLSPEEVRSNLIHKKRQLEKMKYENVEKITDFIESKSDAPPRAESALREVPIEEFDADTAQIEDCEREQKEDGSWRYFAVMFDAKGNSVRVEISAAEGESMYRTMKTIKSSPMMEMIYRKAVLPLLDRQAEKKKTPDSVSAPAPDFTPDSVPTSAPASAPGQAPVSAETEELP